MYNISMPQIVVCLSECLLTLFSSFLVCGVCKRVTILCLNELKASNPTTLPSTSSIEESQSNIRDKMIKVILK